MSSYTLYHGDCLEVMKGIPDGSVDAVITDPPYGINKEEWDCQFPDWIIPKLFDISDLVIMTPGIWSLGKCIIGMKDRYLWTSAGHKGGAMSNGAIGYNKWQPIVIGGKPRKKAGSDAFDFNPSDIGGEIYHSCQKPVLFMVWIIEKFTLPGDTILDPFMGSGTTGVACAKTGRKFIGIEIDEKYFKIAERRIKDAYAQPLLFEAGL